MTSEQDPHGRTRRPREVEEEEDDDPVERMLKRSGCLELHYKVQECMVDHKDWRRCKDVVQQFKACVEEDQRRKRSLDRKQ